MGRKKKSFFVLQLNDGQSHEDYTTWVGGVFSTLEQAVQVGWEKSPTTAWNFFIHEYQLDGIDAVGHHEMDIKADKREVIWYNRNPETGMLRITHFGFDEEGKLSDIWNTQFS